MALSLDQFWNLTAQSRLLDPAQIQHYQATYRQANPGAPADPQVLAQWLIQQNVISKYQASVLLAGKPGPFMYGDYRVYDRIGSGRLKGCFRAVHQATSHPVILEFQTGEVAQGGPAWSNAVSQAKIAAASPHANVTRTYEAVDLSTHKFLVREDLRGQTLEDRLQAGKLSVDEACAVIRQVAVGAAHLNSRGAPHGDIRPGNIWLSPEGVAKLMHTPAQPPMVLTSERADYAAPELAGPGALPSQPADVYACGCTLYHMIAGRPPFPGGDVASKMARHASEAIQPLEQVGAPKPLADAVMYMMAKNIGVRFPTLSQVIEHATPYVGAATHNPPVGLPSQENYLAYLQQKQMARPAQPTAATTQSAPATIDAPVFVDKPAAPIVATNEDEATIAGRRAASNNGLKPWMIASGAAGALLLVVALLLVAFAGGGNQETAQGEGAANGKTISKNGGANTASANGGDSGNNGNNNAAAAGNTGLPDDGKMLWISPTDGEALAFKFVPPGGQVLIALRPADLLATPGGADTLRALDTAFADSIVSSRQRWEKSVGAQLGDLDQLIISLHGNGGKYPRTNYVVRFKEPQSVEELTKIWGVGEPEKVEGKSVYRKGLYTYYPAEDGSVFVMGADEDVREVAERNGAAPAGRREVEQLRRVTDDQRHLTVLFAPHFFFADGLPLFEGETQRAREPLDWFLGDGLQAGAFSLHMTDEYCYGELRLISQLATDSRQLTNQLRERTAEIPAMIEDYLATRVYPPEYWRKVAFRLPTMIQFVHDQMRIGAEDGNAVLNFYAPTEAAPNLALGGSMLMLSAPGRGPVAAAPKPKAPQSIEQLLARQTSMSFDQLSLEFAMRDIANDANETYPGMPFKFTIRIMGGDLEGDGITRNQGITDFSAENKPISDILTAMVMKANPVTTVKKPTELDQKLVWVIADDPDAAGKKVVLITTRKGVAANNYTLPSDFVDK